jgi:hypothetical protein
MCALPTLTSRADFAVIDIDGTGLGTLHVDNQLVDHIVDAQPRLVVRVLLDYATTVGRDLTILTRYADGQKAAHQLRPDGTVAPLRQPTSTDSVVPPGREFRRSSERMVRAVGARDRSLAATAWTWSRRWLIGHGLWLMLCTQILLLVGSLTYMVVALSPYLSP